jgi:hypothetical protein
MKKGETFNGRGDTKKNDQLVADFFDVKSFVSEPDLVSSPRSRKPTLHPEPKQVDGGKKPRHLETSSVVSNRSQRSNVFSRFFQRMRAINDEVLDIDDDDDDVPDLTGTGVYVDDFENSSILDDELTLCSGMDSYSQLGSVQGVDDDDDDSSSQGSDDGNKLSESRGITRKDVGHSGNVSQSAKGENISVPETPFIQRIMQRRILKNEATILRDVVGRSTTTNSSPIHSSPVLDIGNIKRDRAGSPASGKVKLTLKDGLDSTLTQQQQHPSPTNRSKRLTAFGNMESPTQRAKALAQTGMNLTSSKSMSHLPSSIEPVIDDAVQTPPRVTRGICRWNSESSLDSDPSGPKRPTRNRGNSFDRSPGKGIAVASIPSPSKRPTTKNSLDKLVKTSQSMRNLTSPYEDKNGSDEEDDDDSILSLLSGLLATWSAERDGINVTITQELTMALPLTSGARPKSILKQLSFDNEEQKIDSRERYTVRFKAIEIREYERIVGDNPSCSKGPPISIGWGYVTHTHCTLNDYEHLVRGRRRTKKEFHLGADRRTHLLVHEWKCSEEEIRKARREATYIQYCRAKTAFSGSRAAAKEAAFLRKVNDRSKIVEAPPKPQKMLQSNQNDTKLPSVPLRRPTIEVPVAPRPQTNRSVQEFLEM